MGEFLNLNKLQQKDHYSEVEEGHDQPPGLTAESNTLPDIKSVKEGFLMLLTDKMKALLMTNYDGKTNIKTPYGVRLTETGLEYREEIKGGRVKTMGLNFESEEITYNGHPANNLKTEQFFKKMKQVGLDMKSHKLFYFEERKE